MSSPFVIATLIFAVIVAIFLSAKDDVEDAEFYKLDIDNDND
jgi:hypothetical protein